jgi:hypothetical protein
LVSGFVNNEAQEQKLHGEYSTHGDTWGIQHTLGYMGNTAHTGIHAEYSTDWPCRIGVQWNLYNMDTFGTTKGVMTTEVY